MAKKKVKRSDESAAKKVSFEQILAKLEQTVTRLESGELGLDESLSEYERGIGYLKECYRKLERAERKIELLSGVDENGKVSATSFDEGELSLEQKQTERSRRRSRTPLSSGTEDSEAGMDDGGTLF